MRIRSTKGLTFDDPARPAAISLRVGKDVDTSTWLTPAIRLHLPVVSANMDTVTQAAMAIAMARGGLGVIHRFMTIEQQVRQVKQVRRSQGFVVDSPYGIGPEVSIGEAAQLMKTHDVGSLVVTTADGQFVGLITQRDILLAPPDRQAVRDAMTPAEKVVKAAPGITQAEAKAILYEHRMEKLPLVDASGKVAGLITARDVAKAQQWPNATRDAHGRLRVGAAIGLAPGEIERAGALLAAGADCLVLDIAHGHADHCIRMISKLRAQFPRAQIVAGNVATRQGARDLAEAGADAIKVGIGPGSICTTRIVTGFGVPQITAIMDSVEGVRESGRECAHHRSTAAFRSPATW